MAQIFEFKFNPPKQSKVAEGKEDLIFDSFCFEPKNVYEKRIGSLYAIGLLKNALPQNIRLLEALSWQIKEKYYKTVSGDSEKSLKESLRLANEYLEKIAKKGNVSWLGNLNFAVISLKDFKLNFARVGNFKIFLIRKGQIVDVDKNLKLEETDPYPLKIFGNIVSAKLAENDIILILSQEAYDVFLQEKLFNQIAQKSFSLSLPEKKGEDSPPLKPNKLRNFKNILNEKKEELSKISGICLLIVLSKESPRKEAETLEEKKSLKVFSFKEAFAPFANIVKKIKKRFYPLQKKGKNLPALPKINLKMKIPFLPLKSRSQKIKLPRPIILMPKIKVPKLKIFSARIFPGRKMILVAALIVFLASGFFVFEKREAKKIKNYQLQINELKEKINQAQSYIDLAEYNRQARENANILSKEILNEISPLINTSPSLPPSIANQIFELENVLLKNLYQLNSLVEIQEPELFFEINPRELVPQRFILLKDKLYLFSSQSENIFELGQESRAKNEDKEEEENESLFPLAKARTIEANNKFNSAALFHSSIIFFSKPNQVTIFKEGLFGETIYLEEFSSDSDLTYFDSYFSHLYFLETKSNSIVRYPFLSELKWRSPESWFSPETETAAGFKSMAIDGSIWLLTKQNTMQRYYLGKLEEELKLDIFPEIKNLSKVFTSPQHSYLYLLEPIKKRIIILDKKGEVVKQYQSKKFDNLLDFSVSPDGKTIWLLNGMKIYKINF